MAWCLKQEGLVTATDTRTRVGKGSYGRPEGKSAGAEGRQTQKPWRKKLRVAPGLFPKAWGIGKGADNRPV